MSTRPTQAGTPNTAHRRRTMKGVVFLGNRKLELREFPDPTPGPRDVILAIKASGMCGSDLHTYRAPANPGGVVTGGEARPGRVRRVRRRAEGGRGAALHAPLAARAGRGSLPALRHADDRQGCHPAVLTSARLAGIEQVAYPCRESVLCDRLLDHRNAGIEPALMDDGVAGITRRE